MMCHICLQEIDETQQIDKLDLCKNCFANVKHANEEYEQRKLKEKEQEQCTCGGADLAGMCDYCELEIRGEDPHAQ